MKKFISYLLILSMGCIGLAQSKSEKLDTIIDKFEIVETQKQILVQMTIEPLKISVEGQDSIQLVNLENRLTDEFIHSKIKSALFESISNKDLDNLYNFVKTSTYEKYFKTNEMEVLISSSLSEDYTELNNLVNRFEANLETERSIDYFTPIPVDREDGFYATKYYNGVPDKSIELVEKPALTKNDIQEISFDKDYLDNQSLNINFTKEGTKIFYELTKINLGKPIAIVVDKLIISLPIVNEPIPGGRASISGNFSQQELQEIKDRLTK